VEVLTEKSQITFGGNGFKRAHEQHPAQGPPKLIVRAKNEED
jgi:hypothetical protein